MPTTYAHYKHGETVTKKLSSEKRQVIEKYPELFHFGVHGPDLLFYFHALQKNHVNQMGHAIHSQSGRTFFEQSREILEQVKKEREGDYMPSLAYLYGFLCHFSLDVCCHGYIQEKIDQSGVSHLEIEAEFDRELLVRDGLDPLRTKLTRHLAPSGKNARVISRFFKGVSQEEIFRAMTDMVKFLDLLVVPQKTKRRIYLNLLKLAGQYEEKHGLFINFEKNPECADSTEKLMGLFDAATELAVKLIEAFPAVEDKAFGYDFCSLSCLEPFHGEIYPVE